ncbi:hypothetical protein E2C11_21225 [Streptomyces lavendulae]|nr:hypothetical protein E2C11_21225 [Streptomyces lavendulae]
MDRRGKSVPTAAESRWAGSSTRTGTPWRDVSESCGPWAARYARCRGWAAAGPETAA